jgi:hypothetical protein
MKRKGIASITGVFLCASTAFAQIDWIEDGDAGAFPDASGAQGTVGAGLLEHISGGTDVSAGDWTDAYYIDIVAPQFFYATTDSRFDATASSNFDTRLWLFDLNGNLLLGNDDTPTRADLFATTLTDPSTWSNATGGSVFNDPQSLTAGAYVLVISGFGNDPENMDGVDLAALDENFDALHGPNPLAGVFSQYEDNLSDASGLYTIALGGTKTIVPAPAAAVLLGLSGLLFTTRRR